MAAAYYDRIRDNTTSTGTGNLTVSGTPPTNYLTLADRLSISDVFYYTIVHETASEWEVGLGTYLGAGQFSRSASNVLDGSSGPSTLVNFSAGSKVIWLDFPSRVAAVADMARVGAYDTRTDAAAADLSTVNLVRTGGYATFGDGGGGTYAKVASAYTGGFTSADGSFWRLIDDPVNILSFGAVHDGVTNTVTAFNNATTFLSSRSPGYGGTIVFPSGQYSFQGLVNGIPTGVNLRSEGYHGAYLNVDFALGLNTSFLYNATGAVSISIRDFIIQASTACTQGHSILLAPSSVDNGGSFCELRGLYITGSGTFQNGIYLEGTAKSTGAIGVRDVYISDCKVFQCTDSHYRFSGCQALTAVGIFGVPTGAVPSNASIFVTGSSDVPTQEIVIIANQASSFTMSNSAQPMVMIANINDGGAGDTKTVTISSLVTGGRTICSQAVAVVNNSETHEVDGGYSNGFYWPNAKQITSSLVDVTGAMQIYSGTATPAGGTSGSGYLLSNTTNFGTFFGSGAPTLTAAKGSLYLRSDGTSSSNRAYVNVDSSAGWTALLTSS